MLEVTDVMDPRYQLAHRVPDLVLWDKDEDERTRKVPATVVMKDGVLQSLSQAERDYVYMPFRPHPETATGR